MQPSLPSLLVDSLSEADHTVVVIHRQADLDAIGSALSLTTVLSGSLRIIASDGIEKRAQPLVDEHPDGHCVVEERGTPSEGPAIVLDASSHERIAPAQPSPADHPLFVLDHHEPGDLLSRATAAIVGTEATATAVLVARLVDALGESFTPDIAYPLAAGLLNDLSAISGAGEPTLGRLRTLLPNLGSYESKIRPLLTREQGFSERNAVATATAWVTFYRADRRIVVITRIGAYETVAAHGLQGDSVDVVIVLSEEGDRTRVIGRAFSRIVDECPLLGLFNDLIEMLGGEGGGHEEARVAHLETSDTHTIRHQVIENIERRSGSSSIGSVPDSGLMFDRPTECRRVASQRVPRRWTKTHIGTLNRGHHRHPERTHVQRTAK